MSSNSSNGQKKYPPLSIKDLSGIKRKNKGHPDLPQPPFLMITSGPSRAGKSNFIKNLLSRRDMLKGVFDEENIIIICPSLRYNDDFAMMEKAQKFDNFENSLINDIIKEQTMVIDTYGKKRTPHTLIVLDDIADNTQFANSRALQKLAYRGRHMKISLIISVQKWSAIPRGVRINSTHIVLFRPSSWSEVDFIAEELADKENRKQLKQVMKDIFREPYQFIYIDLLNPVLSRRLRHGISKDIDFNWL